MIVICEDKGEKMDRTKIQWTEYSWNPWHGCNKVSEGCKFCYMFRDKEKYGQDPTKVIRSAKSTFNKPLHIKEPSMIFTCSWSDFFIEEADTWRSAAWDIIEETPQHTYQILTKRPERILGHIPLKKLNNVWMGVSIESNKHADRVNYLLPFNGIKFISFEPLLEDIQWRDSFNEVDWIIIGGESGNDKGKYKYRECSFLWIDQLIVHARVNNVKVFVKQVGTHLAKKLSLKNRHGGDINEIPAHERIREYPQ